jgi:hypothetical protein
MGFTVHYTFFNNSVLMGERCTLTATIAIYMLKSAFGHVNILKEGGGLVPCSVKF